MKRRSFLYQSAACFSVAALPTPASGAEEQKYAGDSAADRAYWLRTLLKIADPVLTAAAAGQLKATMPVEAAPGQMANRQRVAHLEALGRTIAGIAPWLEHTATTSAERVQQQRYAALTRQAIEQAVNPQSPGFLNFTQEAQPLVDTAFLAHGLLRAPTQLWERLTPTTQAHLVQALQSSRTIKPFYNNWLLFSAIIEIALLRFAGAGDEVRIDYAIKQHLTWYKGDGIYGDGPDFHWDYYNSYVIQPMLLDVVRTLVEAGKGTPSTLETLRKRAQRYAVIQERLIGPDGSFAAFGRSLAYRCGAFQLLAQMALQDNLAPELLPGQVRSALTAVIRRTLEPRNTFDTHGWLQIGLCGHQPSLGESYISTGSLYLCTVAFLPLGLPATAPFWSEPAQEWTARKIWSGQDMKADHAI